MEKLERFSGAGNQSQRERLLCIKDLDAHQNNEQRQIINKVYDRDGEGTIDHKAVKVTAGKDNNFATRGGKVSCEGILKVLFVGGKVDVAKSS